MISTTKNFATLTVVVLVVIGSLTYLALNQPQTAPQEVEGRRQGLTLKAGLSWFSSYDELGYYVEASSMLTVGLRGLAANILRIGGVPVFFGDAIRSDVLVLPLAVETASPASTVGGGKLPSYSKTNVQVEGVDEADIVKTDGKYIYVASGTKLWIAKAYPPDQLGLAVALDVGERVAGLYVYGDRVVVLTSSPVYHVLPEMVVDVEGVKASAVQARMPVSRVLVYQFGNDSLKLLYNVSVTGSYLTSRMVGSTVYLLAQQPAFSGSNVTIPAVNGEPLEPGRIGYFSESVGTMYINILGVSVEDGSYEATSILSSPASWVYVSLDNLYVVTAATVNMTMVVEMLNDLMGQLQEASNASSPLEVLSILSGIRQLYAELSLHSPATASTIYRFRLANLTVVPEAVGRVPGIVLDQFSMDEYNGYFRIATTTRPWDRVNSSNAVYVLDMNLSLIGSVEGVAKGERIYAARFMGDLCFLVTFRQMDPLFAIDLSDPAEPRVLGFLEMPGFSEYLHPYGENLLIGVGVSENREVKVAVFNISDPANPAKLDELVLGRGYTQVFEDHKAFMVNMEKGYIAIPAVLVKEPRASYAYPKAGSFIIDVDAETGNLSLRGVVPNANPWRTLYIGDIIYSIGSDMVMAYNYTSMEPAGSLILQGFG